MTIAFFDSGVGGLSVLSAARARCPQYDYLYYADCEYAPYGNKPARAVHQRVIEVADSLAAHDIEALVVACNTATAVAIDTLRQRFSFPVIGMEPAIKPALHKGQGKKVLVMATSLTLQESKLSELLHSLDAAQRVDKLAMDGLVNFAEGYDFESASVVAYIREQLSAYDLDDYDSIVLGCTHFIYYKQLISKQAGAEVSIIDGNEGTVNHLFSQLAAPTAAAAGKVEFLLSGRVPSKEESRKLQWLLAR
ncbi:glutamate racemase [Aliidiomarina sp. Khilg15.8]